MLELVWPGNTILSQVMPRYVRLCQVSQDISYYAILRQVMNVYSRLGQVMPGYDIS